MFKATKRRRNNSKKVKQPKGIQDRSIYLGLKDLDMEEIRDKIKPNSIIKGPLFKEQIKVSHIIPMGDEIKLIGKGLETLKARINSIVKARDFSIV